MYKLTKMKTNVYVLRDFLDGRKCGRVKNQHVRDHANGVGAFLFFQFPTRCSDDEFASHHRRGYCIRNGRNINRLLVCKRSEKRQIYAESKANSSWFYTQVLLRITPRIKIIQKLHFKRKYWPAEPRNFSNPSNIRFT